MAIVDPDTLDILAQTAALAGIFGLPKEAMTIVEAVSVAAADPDDDNVAIVLATAYLSGRRFDDAIGVLRDKVLARNPDNESAQAFLALTCHLANRRGECDTLCRGLIASGSDPEAVALARELMDG